MRYKKVTALVLAAAMTVGMLAGCGDKEGDSVQGDTSTSSSGSSSDADTSAGAAEGGNNEGDATDGTAGDSITFPLAETMEFTAFSGMKGDYVLGDIMAMQAAMENANIHITFESVLNVDLESKRNLKLGTEDYPDMFYKASLKMDDLNKYGSQGIFIPLEDLIRQYAPNLTARLDERDGWQYITSPDGHIYSLPEFSTQLALVTPLWINKRWMDNLELKEPTSLEELYNVLKAFKEQDANGNGDPTDEIPANFVAGDTINYLLAYENFTYDNSTRMAVVDGEFTYIPTTEYYKEYIAYITRLYQEGLLNEDCFTQKGEQQVAIGQAGDVFGSFVVNASFQVVGRDNDDDYIMLTPFQKGTYPLRTGITPGSLAITDACENPEVLVAWADQFYTEEGAILAYMGIEGKTYKVNEDGSWEWITGNSYGDDIAEVRLRNTIQGNQNHPGILPDFWSKMSADADPDDAYLTAERQKVAAMCAKPLPQLNYSSDDAATIAAIKTDTDAYITQYLSEVVTGKQDLEESWDAYVKTMNDMGAGQLESIYKAAYEKASDR